MPDLAILITQVLLASKTLIGKKPGTVLCSVPYPDFISALTGELPNFMTELNTDTRNVLLTLARIWNTITTHYISSKSTAANWAISNMPKEYTLTLKRARNICQGKEKEKWHDIEALIKPCAEFMITKIHAQIKASKSTNAYNTVTINPKDLL